MSQYTFLESDFETLAEPLLALFDGYREEFSAWIKLHRLLLEGKPVSPDRIADYLGLGLSEVAELLRGTELDEDGNLVGAGLSLVPTAHAYRIHGRQLYVWCAADAIMFPIFHRATVEIESPDPISGETIRLTSTTKRVRDVEPATAVVSWVAGKGTPQDVRAWFCSYTNFFASLETASKYVAKRPGLVIVPIDQVFRIGQLMWEREPYRSLFNELSKYPGSAK